jgi:hypothetical protein
MTSQSPRIYLYKITFEEVPYYYYGVHKEKKYNEYYMGSPITNKWCWELYTPKKQILEVFPYTDEGWLSGNKIEKRIISYVLNDNWCLNENCGCIFSIKSCSIAGKIGGGKSGKLNYKNKVGIHAQTKEERDAVRRKGHQVQKELGVGFWGLTKEERSKNCKKTISQKWQCTITGYIANPGALSNYQKHRGINTCNRIKIE